MSGDDEPEWDSDARSESSGGEEGSFDDEGTEDGSIDAGTEDGSIDAGTEDGSIDAGTEDGSYEDVGDEGDEVESMGSDVAEEVEQGFESGSEEGPEEGSFQDDESGDDPYESEEDQSHNESESSEVSQDSSEDEDPFEDEEAGAILNKNLSSGSLMNEPDENEKPKWAKLVPAAILAFGIWAAVAFCCCIIFIPLMVIIIPLAVLLPGGNDGAVPFDEGLMTNVTGVMDNTDFLTSIPTASPTIANVITNPTVSPETPQSQPTVLDSGADTTIYRDGVLSESAAGNEDTMLVQSGVAGNDELPSAYALVQFDGKLNIDGDMTVAEYLNAIPDAVVDFCFNVATDGDGGTPGQTFSTCLLAPPTEDIEQLTGANADYRIPESCLNGAVEDFQVTADSKEVCVNVADMLRTPPALPEIGDENPPALRGRALQETTLPPDALPEELADAPVARNPEGAGQDVSFLFIIDAVEEFDGPGTRFYTNADPERGPTLTIPPMQDDDNGGGGGAGAGTGAGDNCLLDYVCGTAELSKLCGFIEQAGLDAVLSVPDPENPFRTIFAPTNSAFDNLDEGISAALADIDALTDVLLYHIVNGDASSSNLGCGESLKMGTMSNTTTFCGPGDLYYQIGNGVSPGVNTVPKILDADIEACDGVIHTMEEVLIPGDTSGNLTCVTEGNQTLIEMICESEDHKTFCESLQSTGLDNVLAEGRFTVFAPTDTSFSSETLPPEILTFILLQHVISGSAISSSDLSCDQEVMMATGEPSKITCGEESVFFIGGDGNVDPDTLPTIIAPDLLACNGIIHSIDQLILPGISETVDEDGDDMDDIAGEFAPCGICEPGLQISELVAEVEVPDSVGLVGISGSMSCKAAEDLCLGGFCSPETCAEFAGGLSAACGCKETASVVALLGDSPDTYSSFLDFLKLSDYASLIFTNSNPITVLAPNNAAIEALTAESPDVVAQLATPEWIVHLEDILGYHAIDGALPSTDITDGLVQTALNEEELTFSLDGADVVINSGEAKVIDADALPENGVIHTLDSVLLPSWVGQNLLDVAQGIDDLATLMTFAGETNLATLLSEPGPYTIFAPSNEAVQELLQMGIDPSLIDIESVLSYHIVPGLYPASTVTDGLALATMHGEDVILNVMGSTATVMGERIVDTDILANNGIIHVIDGILLPSDMELPIPDGLPPPPDMSGAQTQSCSICTGVRGDAFTLTNPDAVISIPEGMSIPTFTGTEGTCAEIEDLCQIGYCDAQLCSTFAVDGASDTCGCE